MTRSTLLFRMYHRMYHHVVNSPGSLVYGFAESTRGGLFRVLFACVLKGTSSPFSWLPLSCTTAEVHVTPILAAIAASASVVSMCLVTVSRRGALLVSLHSTAPCTRRGAGLCLRKNQLVQLRGGEPLGVEAHLRSTGCSVGLVLYISISIYMSISIYIHVHIHIYQPPARAAHGSRAGPAHPSPKSARGHRTSAASPAAPRPPGPTRRPCRRRLHAAPGSRWKRAGGTRN